MVVLIFKWYSSKDHSSVNNNKSRGDHLNFKNEEHCHKLVQTFNARSKNGLLFQILIYVNCKLMEDFIDFSMTLKQITWKYSPTLKLNDSAMDWLNSAYDKRWIQNLWRVSFNSKSYSSRGNFPLSQKMEPIIWKSEWTALDSKIYTQSAAQLFSSIHKIWARGMW